MSTREFMRPMGKLPRWAVLLVAVILAAGSIWQQSQRESTSQFPDSTGAASAHAEPATTSATQERTPRNAVSGNSDSAVHRGQQRATATIIHDVSVEGFDGRIVFRGDVDLQPTLDRIERGERFPHRNDGGIFRNLERRLPIQADGHYREYVHPTPGIDGPGPQRVIVGRHGEVYYTFDHYRTFRQIR